MPLEFWNPWSFNLLQKRFDAAFQGIHHPGVRAKADLHWAGLQCRDFHQRGPKPSTRWETPICSGGQSCPTQAVMDGAASVAVQGRGWLEQGPPAWFEKGKVNFGGWELCDTNKLLMGMWVERWEQQ